MQMVREILPLYYFFGSSKLTKSKFIAMEKLAKDAENGFSELKSLATSKLDHSTKTVQ